MSFPEPVHGEPRPSQPSLGLAADEKRSDHDHVSGRRKVSFRESIENERGFGPLINPASFSSQLRRRLLRGEELSADDGVAIGGTNGVLGATCKLMSEWGFEFLPGTTNAEGKRTYKLKNPRHVPTVHTPRVPGPSRKRHDDAGSRKSGPSPLHDAIRDKLLSGEEISCVETMQMGASEALLRKLVKKLESEGYAFGIRGHGPERTYILSKSPRGGRKGSTSRTEAPSTALARPIGKHIEMANGGNGHVPTNAVDMLFGDLMMPTPRLGGAVRIMGAALNEDDESLTVLFKNGSGAWTARLEGYVEAEAD